MFLIILTQYLSYCYGIGFIILLFGFGPQSPMKLMSLMKKILLQVKLDFEKRERFNPEAATGGAL